MDMTLAIVIIISVILVWYLWMNNQCKEGLGGFGVTSALAFNNRIAYCDPGNEDQGGSYSGGCMLNHQVIL